MSSATPGSATARFAVVGMDCAADAAEIESAARAIEGVETAKVSTALHVLNVTAETAETAEVFGNVERAVRSLGYDLRALASDSEQGVSVPSIAPAYRRALWIVVLLNLGYGIAEGVGGFIADSQALKADALDFVGDGLITFLGLLAVGWSLAWRARMALVQGVFLGLLGLGVLASTAYRVLITQQPEAGLMGMIGFGALLVNVAAALVLIPHRTGDANARAIWLFSRNDAIGNLAVVLSSGLVAWSGTPCDSGFSRRQRRKR